MPKILNKYPIDTIEQVKTASAYFEDHWHRFSLSERAEYARGVAQAMKTAGIKLSKFIDLYGGEPRESPQDGLSIRSVMVGEKYKDDVEDLKKLAGKVPPAWLVNAIETFDKKANLQKSYNRIPDPHRTVYRAASEKIAQKWTGSTDTLQERTLKAWVSSPEYRTYAETVLSPDLVDALGKDPWVIFSSLPEPTKKVIARIANDKTFPGEVRIGLSEYDEVSDGEI